MDATLAVLVTVIVLALIFDFINGFHDAANSIATVVATRVLTPLQAVTMAAFFNFVSFLVFPLAVADTIAKTVNPAIVDNAVIAAALIGASGWNLITWHHGLPSSSSHALTGALIGTAVTKWLLTPALFGDASMAPHMGTLLNLGALGKVLLFIALAPLVGLALGGGIALALTWIIRSRAIANVTGPLLGLLVFGLAAHASGWSNEPWRLHLGTGHDIDMGLPMAVWGWILGLLVAVGVVYLFRDPRPKNIKNLFRRGQILSAAFYSLGHGGNDAQKTMGIIIALLLSVPIVTVMGADGKPVVGKDGKEVKVPALDDKVRDEKGNLVYKTDKSGKPIQKIDKATKEPVFKDGKPVYEVKKKDPDEYVPLWVVLSCHAAMGLGTLFGGWKIVKTMGRKLIHLRPVDGFCAEGGAAVTLVLTAVSGISVSTTQTITGSIVGVGAVNGIGGVKWGVFERIIYAWILTIPGAFVIAGVSWVVFSRFG